jgi:cephalosporin-C deacetylase-like acetyl esterase
MVFLQFEEVFRCKQLEERRTHLQFKNSYESLSSYQEFQDKVCVLQKLGYIDSKNSGG